MKKLLILLILSITAYAECTLDMDAITAEQQRCGAECMKLNDLIKRSDCVNVCNGEWMRAQDEYYACRRLEEENKDVITTGRKASSIIGNVELNGEKLTNNYQIKAGDRIKTGTDSTVILESDQDTVRIIGGTQIQFIGLQFSPPQITGEIPWDQDPNYKLETDDIGFWKQLFKDIADFNLQNPPKYLYSCATANYKDCPTGIIMYIIQGTVWFDKKIKEDYPTIVMTPKAAINTYGTQYIVDVKDNGDTTVTTLQGKVLVTDLKTRQSQIGDLEHKITIPETVTETVIEQAEIKETGLTKAQTTMIAIAITALIIVLAIIIRVHRKR